MATKKKDVTLPKGDPTPTPPYGTAIKAGALLCELGEQLAKLQRDIPTFKQRDAAVARLADLCALNERLRETIDEETKDVLIKLERLEKATSAAGKVAQEAEESKCSECADKDKEIERLEKAHDELEKQHNDCPDPDELKADALEALRSDLAFILEWGCAKGAEIIDLRGRLDPDLDDTIREWGLLHEPARRPLGSLRDEGAPLGFQAARKPEGHTIVKELAIAGDGTIVCRACGGSGKSSKTGPCSPCGARGRLPGPAPLAVSMSLQDRRARSCAIRAEAAGDFS